MSARVRGSTVLVGLMVGACRRTPPPVPFTSDAQARPTIVLDHPDAAHDAGARAAAPTLSSAVPGNGSTIEVDGASISAPDGVRFGRFLALDFDGDGDRDVVVTRLKPDGAAAGVHFYRRDPAGFASLDFIGTDGPSDPRCTHAELHATSSHAVVVSFSAPDDAPPPAIGARALASEHVVLAVSPPAERTRVSVVAASLPDTVVDVSVDTLDRDADGRDDAVATVSVRRAGERAEVAVRTTVVLLDRPAGPARELSEPGASLDRAIGSVRNHLARHRGVEALAALDRLERLRLALCTESNLARVNFGPVTGVPCAGAAVFRAIPELRTRALLAMGEVPAALATFVPEMSGERGAVTSDRLLADVLRAAPVATGLTARQGPDEMGSQASSIRAHQLSSLGLEPQFEPRSIVVRGVMAGTVDIGTLGPFDGPPGNPDDLLARAPDGTYIARDFVEDCTGPAVMLCRGGDDACLHDPIVPGPLPAGRRVLHIPELPRTEHIVACLQRDPATVPLRAESAMRLLGWGRDGLLVARAGRLYKFASGADIAVPVGRGDLTGGPFPGGCAVSRDGQFLVLGAREALFVRDIHGAWSRWMPTELAGQYGTLDELTISNDGNTIAGLIGSHIWLTQRAAGVVH